MMFEAGKSIVDRVFTVSSKTTLLVTVSVIAWITQAPIPAIDQVRYASCVAVAFILGQKFKEALSRNGSAEGG